MVVKREKTILLVEDDPIVTFVEKTDLEKEGYRVVAIDSGEKAIDYVRVDNNCADLILMDIDLGDGIDGTLAAEEILKTHDIPILFLSSHTEKHIVSKTENISSYGYVVKNSCFTVLNASIKMAFKLFESKMVAKEKESALSASEKRFRHFFEIPIVGIAITSADKKWIEVNDKLCEILGYSRNELFNLTWADLTPKNDIDTEIKKYSQVLKGDYDSETFEKVFIRKNGSPVNVQICSTCVRNPDNSVDYFISLVQDQSSKFSNTKHVSK